MTRVLLGAVVALLVTVPLAANAGRSEKFAASFGVDVRGHPLFTLPGREPGYVRELLRDKQFRRDTVELSGLPIDDASLGQRLDVDTTPSGTAVRARASTPERARRLADAARQALEPTARGAFRAEAAARRRFVRARLKSPLTSGAERRRLVAQLRALPRFFRRGGSRLALGGPPVRPRPSSSLDRAADALPGPFPPAASLLSSTASGLLAAAALGAIVAAARLSGRSPGPGRRRSAPVPSPRSRPRRSSRRHAPR